MNRKKLMLLPLAFVALIFFLSFDQHHVSSYDEQRVLVIFREQINESLLEEVHATVHHRFETIASVAISVENNNLPRIKNHPDTLLVEEDHIVEIEFDYSEQQWPLTKTNVPSAWESTYTGSGIKIAVIDTGVDMDHPDLKIKDGACFNTGVVNGCKNSFQDDNGHGTHVAGIIAAYNPTMPFYGVVPEATLYVIKAMDSEGKGNTSDIIKGIEWAMERDVDIINLSLSTENDSTLLKLAIEKAYNSGILVVAAAGNKGNSNGSGDNVEYPAKYDTVIAVASVNQRNRRSDFSATGPTIEIAAPGEQIYSTFPLMLDRDGNPNGYTLHSGTSMAAPYVAGILALYKQQNPHLSHKELRELLRENTLDLGQEGVDPWFGYGLIQAVQGIVLKAPILHIEQTEFGNIQFYWEAVEHASYYQIFRDGELIKEQEHLKHTDWLVKGNYEYEVIAISENGKRSEVNQPILVEITTADFADLKNGSWYTPHMIYLSNRSIVTGFPDNTLRPYANVTRAQAVTMIGRALGFDKDEPAPELEDGNLANEEEIKVEDDNSANEPATELEGDNSANEPATEGEDNKAEPRLGEDQPKPAFTDVDKDSFAYAFIQQAYEQKIVTGFPDGTFRPNQPVTRAEMAILIARAYQYESDALSIFTDVTEQMQAYEAINSVAANKITIGYDDGTFRPEEHMNRLQFAVFIARAENELFR